MATWESEKRMQRRRSQRFREEFNADPEIIAFRHAFDQRQKYLGKHPFSGRPPGLLYMHCVWAGWTLGGRAKGSRRCTKRLGTRVCHNWRIPGTTRCYRHVQEGGSVR
jgi:hypothetical protein